MTVPNQTVVALGSSRWRSSSRPNAAPAQSYGAVFDDFVEVIFSEGSGVVDLLHFEGNADGGSVVGFLQEFAGGVENFLAEALACFGRAAGGHPDSNSHERVIA